MCTVYRLEVIIAMRELAHWMAMTIINNLMGIITMYIYREIILIHQDHTPCS